MRKVKKGKELRERTSQAVSLELTARPWNPCMNRRADTDTTEQHDSNGKPIMHVLAEVKKEQGGGGKGIKEKMRRITKQNKQG